MVRFGLFLRLVVIMKPIGFRSREGSEPNRDCGCDKKQSRGFHSAIFDAVAAGRKSGTTHRRCGDYFFPSPQ